MATIMLFCRSHATSVTPASRAATTAWSTEPLCRKFPHRTVRPAERPANHSKCPERGFRFAIAFSVAHL